jgi:hypothetical protein
MARNPIPYRVECRDVIGGFETIAGFDVEPAAMSYARKCAAGALAGSAGSAYRPLQRGIVTYRGKVLRDFSPTPKGN